MYILSRCYSLEETVSVVLPLLLSGRDCQCCIAVATLWKRLSVLYCRCYSLEETVSVVFPLLLSGRDCQCCIAVATLWKRLSELYCRCYSLEETVSVVYCRCYSLEETVSVVLPLLLSGRDRVVLLLMAECNCTKLTPTEVTSLLLKARSKDHRSKQRRTVLYCPFPGCSLQLRWWGEKQQLLITASEAEVRKRATSTYRRLQRDLKENHGKLVLFTCIFLM